MDDFVSLAATTALGATQLKLWSSVLLASVLSAVCKAVYNIYFHPLSRYPGPRLASATLWWQTWIEVITGQSLSLKLVELHDIYGAFYG